MKFFFYSKLHAIQGYLVDIYEGDFIEFCRKECLPSMQHKDDFPLFTPALFGKNGSNRTLAELTSHNNLVLDFDNKEAITDYDDIARELSAYTFIAYDTFSSTKEKRKFRYILPLSRDLDEKSYLLLKDKVIHVLQGNLDGIDASTFDRARAFYIPSPNCFTEFNKGVYFNDCKLYLDQELNTALPFNAANKGRNDSIKSQIFAALEKNTPINQIVEEIFEYDLKNYNPPLFSDPLEKFKTNDPKVNALNFVSNCAVTHANAHRKSITLKEETSITVNVKDLINFQVKADEAKKNDEAFYEFDQSLCKAPGLVGEIADWITASSFKPIPALSLAAALTGVGMVKAHRVRSETDLRTNLYTIGLAPSGGGKEDSMKLMKKLLKSSGHGTNLIGEPESGSGLISSLETANYKAFLGWNEVGMALQYYTDKNANGHLSKVIKLIIRLFSEANTSVSGGEYATRSRIDLDQPCLSIYGSSVPDEFFKALSLSHGSNGFLARWLIFATNKLGVENLNAGKESKIPQSFINQLESIRAMPSSVLEKQSDIQKHFITDPKIVPYTPDARLLLGEIREFYQNKMQKFLDEGNGLESVWQRAQEHIIKIALILSDNNFITRDELDYSYRLVESILAKSSQMYLENRNQGEFANLCKEILEIVRQKGRSGVTLSQLGRIRKVNPTLRDQAIKALKESEQVLEVVTKKGKAVTTTLFYQR